MKQLLITVCVLFALTANAQFTSSDVKQAYQAGELNNVQYIQKLEYLLDKKESNQKLSLVDQYVLENTTGDFEAQAFSLPGVLSSAFKWLLPKIVGGIIDYFNMPCEKDTEKWAEFGRTVFGRYLEMTQNIE